MIIACISLCFFATAQGIRVKSATNITVENGSYMVVKNNGHMLLEADQNETASLIDRNSSGHIMVSGNGKAKDECYISEEMWHYVSSPVTDENADAFSNMYLIQFSESTGEWTYITDPLQSIVPFHGYGVWAAADLTGSKTITFEGSNFNAGTHTFSVTHHGNASHNHKGLNFVGNPYPSAINWQNNDGQGWTRTGLTPVFYLWNPDYGNYGNYNRNTQTGINNVNNIIPANQGFFVNLPTDGSTTLQVNNQARLHHSSGVFKLETDAVNCLTFSCDENGYRDETKIMLHENATENYDTELDALKLEGSEDAPQLYTLTDDKNLSVNAFSEINEEKRIPMAISMPADGLYTLECSGAASFAGEHTLFLLDLKTTELHNLREISTVTFDYNTSDEQPRFEIIFKNSTHTPELTHSPIPSIFVDNNRLFITFDGDENQNDLINIRIFNLLGQEMLGQKIRQKPPIRINTHLPGGFYLVNLSSKKLFHTQKVYFR